MKEKWRGRRPCQYAMKSLPIAVCPAVSGGTCLGHLGTRAPWTRGGGAHGGGYAGEGVYDALEAGLVTRRNEPGPGAGADASEGACAGAGAPSGGGGADADADARVEDVVTSPA